MIKIIKKTNEMKTMEVESPYFDENGMEIKEFDVIKMVHFTAKRKIQYVYKWIKLVDVIKEKWWAAYHLSDNKGDYFYLRYLDHEDNQLKNVQVCEYNKPICDGCGCIADDVRIRRLCSECCDIIDGKH